VAGGVELLPGEYEIDLVANLAEGKDGEATDLIGILPGGGFLILDAAVTNELAREGAARDLVRLVQQARKDADFDVSDRIRLVVTGNAEVVSIASEHAELIKSETLSLELELIDGTGSGAPSFIGEDIAVFVTVARI
jgi:isoleucyl-tRNA synthetase